jgi:hypothetical protein
MKQIDKKDMPKVIGLGVALVALLGYTGFSLLGGAGPASQPANAQGDVKPQPGDATDDPNKRGGSPSEPLTLAESLETFTMRPSGNDPFQPNGELIPKPAPSPGVATPQPSPSPLPVPATSLTPGGTRLVERWKPQTPRTPPIEVAPPVLVATPVPTPTPAPTPPPAPPAFTLKGVVVGEESVAILRGGEDLKFVQEGYPVGNGYIVGVIRRDSVDLVYEKDPSIRIRLSLTDSDKKEAAKK